MRNLKRNLIPPEWRGRIAAAYVSLDGSQNALVAIRENPGLISNVVERWLVSGDTVSGPFDDVSDVHVPAHPRKACAQVRVGTEKFVTWGEKLIPVGRLHDGNSIADLLSGPDGPCFSYEKSEDTYIFDATGAHGPYGWVDFVQPMHDGTLCYIGGSRGDSRMSLYQGGQVIATFQDSGACAVHWLGGKPIAFVGQGYFTYQIQPGGNLIAIGRKGPEGKYIQIGNERRPVTFDFNSLQWSKDGKSLMWAEQDAAGGWSVYDGMSVVASFDSTFEWFEETGNGGIAAKLRIGGKNAIRCSDGTLLWLSQNAPAQGNLFKFRPPYGAASLSCDTTSGKAFLWLGDQLVTKEAFPHPASFDVAASGKAIAFTDINNSILVAFGKQAGPFGGSISDVVFPRDASCVGFSEDKYTQSEKTKLLFPDGTTRIGSVNGAAIIYVDGDDVVTGIAE